VHARRQEAELVIDAGDTSRGPCSITHLDRLPAMQRGRLLAVHVRPAAIAAMNIG
jgi:hypothetical protein